MGKQTQAQNSINVGRTLIAGIDYSSGMPVAGCLVQVFSDLPWLGTNLFPIEVDITGDTVRYYIQTDSGMRHYLSGGIFA